MTYRHPNLDSSDNESPNSDIPASSDGKRARIWVIAHCIIQDGVIVREWLVRDNKYLFEQLGVCPGKVATNWARNWMNEINKNVAPENPEHVTQYDWLKSEFKRVTILQDRENTDQEKLHIDLQNIFPISRRESCYLVGKSLALRYKAVWGKEGMSSKNKFTELVKAVYHPHARFESPQNHDAVGHEELEDLYDSFVFGNGHGENIAISLDWIIIKPEDGGRKYFETKVTEHGSSLEKGYNRETNNAWTYPTPSDVKLRHDMINESSKQFDGRKNEHDAPESFTLAIRWTLVGRKKEVSSGQDNIKCSVPIVLLAESHLRCVGYRIRHDITVYDAVAVQAQLELGKQLIIDNSQQTEILHI